MKSFFRQSDKLGLAPGSHVFVGEQKQENVQITIMDYDANNFELKECESIEEIFAYQNRKTVSWANVYGLHETEILKKIETQFNIHPLVTEDILNTSQRPKLEVFDDYIFAVIKMVYFNEENLQIETEQISLILHHNFVLCFQERKGDIFNPLRERIKNSKGRIRKKGSDYLAYAILDVIIDNYFIALEKIGDQIEVIDEELGSDPNPEVVQKINTLKRTLISMRKNTWPLREAIHQLSRDEVPYFSQETLPFLRDLNDHIIQVMDTTESHREIVSSLMDMYMSAVSNRMNEVMKVLTIIATIFIPLSFLAGIYGMNFDTSISPLNMPELSSRYGYIFFWILTIIIGGGLLLFFRKKKWL